MKVKVLGCSGGIGGRQVHTTSLLVDSDILVDAGTGVGELEIEELARIDHVFVTHSHLDHICCLPLMVDTVGHMRKRPLTVHASRATLDALHKHIFNWSIWPDFTAIPSPERAFMRFSPLEVGESVALDGRRITALPAVHTVPAAGYQLDSGHGSLVFSGDTTANDAFWKVVNRIPGLRHLVIETAFANGDRKLAELSKHLCPAMLADELHKLQGRPDIWITHLKPGEAELIMREVSGQPGDRQPRMLQHNQEFEF